MMNEADQHQEIRDAVRHLCSRFPDEYFRKVDKARAYDERVKGMASHFAWSNRRRRVSRSTSSTRWRKRCWRGCWTGPMRWCRTWRPAPLGRSFDALHAKHPRPIVCDISGYGDDGPYRDKKAYDLLIQSESGFLSVTGSPDEPAKAGSSIADIAAGICAYTAILTVMLGLQNEREWGAFCRQVLRRPELATDERYASNSRRTAERQALRSIIVESFAALSAEQVIARLEEAQIANARMNDMHDVWKHPQLHARGRWTEVDTPTGPVPALLPPGETDAYTPRMDAVPGLGRHTGSVLAELGWNTSGIEALRTAGVI